MNQNTIILAIAATVGAMYVTKARAKTGKAQRSTDIDPLMSKAGRWENQAAMDDYSQSLRSIFDAEKDFYV